MIIKKIFFKTFVLLSIHLFITNSCSFIWQKNGLYVKIKSIHDGDTLTDSKGNIYRFFGIDTPEIGFVENKIYNDTSGIEFIWALEAKLL